MKYRQQTTELRAKTAASRGAVAAVKRPELPGSLIALNLIIAIVLLISGMRGILA